MTVDAGGSLEDAPPSVYSVIRLRLLILLLNPAFELIAGLDIDAQKHLGVLRAAILRALSQVKTRLVRINPHRIHAIGNQIGLARKARNPEAVIGISGSQGEEGRSRMPRVAQRHVQFISCYDLQPGITK